MCYAKPGPRCSAHAKESLTASITKAKTAIESGNKGNIKKALVDFEEKFAEYATTDEGQKTINNSIIYSRGLRIDNGVLGDTSDTRYVALLAQGNQVQKARKDSFKNHGPEIPVRIDDPNSPSFEKNARKDLKFISSLLNTYTEKENKAYEEEENKRWLQRANGRGSRITPTMLKAVPTKQRGEAFKEWSRNVDTLRVSDSFLDPHEPRWKNRAAHRIHNYENLSPEIKKQYGTVYKEWMKQISQRESQDMHLGQPSQIKRLTPNEKIKSLLGKIGSKTPNKITEF
jgi:hypothetical protein